MFITLSKDTGSTCENIGPSADGVQMFRAQDGSFEFRVTRRGKNIASFRATQSEADLMVKGLRHGSL